MHMEGDESMFLSHVDISFSLKVNEQIFKIKKKKEVGGPGEVGQGTDEEGDSGMRVLWPWESTHSRVPFFSSFGKMLLIDSF